MDNTTKSQEQLALEYPQLKADIDWCYECLFDLCQGTHKKAIMSVPPRKENFDMQMSAAFDELKAYREGGLTPEQVAEWARAEREGRTMVMPCKVGDTVYGIDGDEVRELKVTHLQSVQNGEIAYTAECTEEHEGCHCYERYCGIRFGSKNMAQRGVYLTRSEAEAAIEGREGEHG